MRRKKPELLAPVSNLAMLRSAIDAGADAVYFGAKGLNMRIPAGNFELNDIRKVVDTCHKSDVKAYLTINTIIYDSELAALRKLLDTAKKAKIDAVIVWDIAAITEAKKRKIPIHISTQASVSNTEAALFFKKLGAERIVLARELSLTQVKKIKKDARIGIEVFVHGAMCVSISGRCFLSQFTFGKSANRGQCIQPCRRTYTLRDKEEDFEYELGNDYVLSPKDLFALPFLDKLVDAGIDSFKIEGRQKSAEYVYAVTKAYREAIDACVAGRFDKALVAKLTKEVEKVYNRGFSKGFYLGRPMNEWVGAYGSVATERKVHLGRVINFYRKSMVAEVYVEANTSISQGDEVYIIGPTTGSRREKALLHWDGKRLSKAKQGDSFTMKVEGVVRKNDAVYKIEVVKND